MTRTTIITLAAAVALTGTAFAGPSAGKTVTPPMAPPPPDDTLGINLDVGYETHYIFRGGLVSEHNLWGALSTEIPLADKVSLGLSAWYTSATDDLDYEELDLSPTLFFDAGFAKIGAVYTWYKFFDGNVGDGVGYDDVNELGLTVSKSLSLGTASLNLAAGYYYDFEDEGSYIEFGVDSPIVLCDRVTLIPSALVSYGVDYYSEEDGFQHLKIGLAADIKLTKNATLTPWVAGNIPLDTYEDVYDDEIYGGVKLRVTF